MQASQNGFAQSLRMRLLVVTTRLAHSVGAAWDHGSSALPSVAAVIGGEYLAYVSLCAGPMPGERQGFAK